MGYIGSDPVRNDSVSTAQLADDAVTNPKIVDDITFTNVTASAVSASGTIVGSTFEGTFSGALSGSDQIATNISGSFTSLSSSLSSRITSEESDFTAAGITGSFTPASSSFSTRVTTEEANVDTLQSTMTSEQTNIDNLQTDSGSFSTRTTLTEASASNLVTDSGSFSTRVTTEEANVDTLQSTMTSEQTNIDNLQTDSGSLASRATTLEGSGTIQGVGTTNAVTFATVDTGQGANELYDMDQNVLTTSSPTFADLTATGTVTAQEFHTEFVSASIMYSSGSTKFGDTSDDIHQFTGSIHLVNSGSISGSSTSTGSFGSAHIADKVGIGVTSPAAKLDVSGSVFPEGDNFHDLGSAAKRWANLYVGDMQLNNKGSGGNEVDGTEGNWTLQEGEENLYVINRKTGKKFKIKLEEM